MCVIAVSLKGRKFSESDLRKMWNANPHGAGVAFVMDDRVRVIKGLMKFDDLLKVYESIPNNTVHAIHFRLRSAGDISPQLTHPFRVDGIDKQQLRYTAKEVLFHNGTVSDWRNLYLTVLHTFRKRDRDKILALPRVSDTYVVALIVYRYGHKILEHLDLHGKWLIFRAQDPVFYGFWDEDKENGFKFSNLSWKWSYDFGLGRSSYRSYSAGWKGSCDVSYNWYKKGNDNDDV
jgi:hypothetical protein